MANRLSDEDVIRVLKQLGIKVTAEQLLRPTKDLVIQLYVSILAEFGVYNVSQPDIEVTSGFDDISNYESVIQVVNIKNLVTNFVSYDGIRDVTLNDVVNPNGRRTKRILRSLCKLVLKLSDITTVFNRRNQWCVDLPVRRQAIEQRIREQKRQIEAKAMHLSTNKCQTVAISRQLKEMAKNFETKRTSAIKLINETKQIKSSILQQNEEISELDIKISKTKEDIEKLNENLVKSPIRIQMNTEKKETELSDKRNEKKILEKQYLQLIKGNDSLKEFSHSLKPSLETLSKTFKDIETIRQECQKLSDMKTGMNAKLERLKSIDVRIGEQEKSWKTLRQQMVNNEKQFDYQFRTLKQIVDGMKGDVIVKKSNQCEAKRRYVDQRNQLLCRLNQLDGQYNAFKTNCATLENKISLRMNARIDKVNDKLNDFNNILDIKN
ncbi:uncharacterized protein LOC128955329 [Oppia nitens]|uniref:uncharacterized protein LOC128955329 n=1 Tax=Oppia nitens TaxID=1686743 RepID=UPI0023DCEB6A|nr:uncharacterized protein LOC128955329 [Oppia nitens]